MLARLVFSFLAVCTLTACSATSSPVAPRPLVIWHGLGDWYSSPGIQQFASLVEDMYPGIFIHSIYIDDDAEKDRRAGFYGNVNEQIQLVANQLATIPQLQNGFDAVGFSQGGQFLRAYVERFNEPPVNNLITFGSQHMGISDLPLCRQYDFICQVARRTARKAVYGKWAQNNLVQAQYFRDPSHYNTYLAMNRFLASINNEVIDTKNGTYARQLASLNKLVLVIFTNDKTVVPKESSWFGSQAIEEEAVDRKQGILAASGTIMPMRMQPLYLEDWIGLRELDERNGVVLDKCEGEHMDIGSCWERLVRAYAGWAQSARASSPAAQALSLQRLRHPRHHLDPNRISDALSDSNSNDTDDQDDQPTPKLTTNAHLAAETPAARLRALLSRVPAARSPPTNPVPPPFSSHPYTHPSDLVDSDLDAPDAYNRVPSASQQVASSSSFSHARESLRDIFIRARREPGGTPQREKTPRARRSSFDASEVDSFPRTVRDKFRRSAKRKSLSDEEIEKLPERHPDQPSASGSRTMSIDELRERLLMESQTQLQDQLPPSLYEPNSDELAMSSRDLTSSQATPPAATSTPQPLSRRTANSQTDSHLPSQVDLQTMIQSNLLDSDSEMQRAVDNVESEGDFDGEYDHVPFPPTATNQEAEPPTPPPTSSTPGRPRARLTRSRLNSLDKAYAAPSSRRTSTELRRSVSRTSMNSTHSSMSLCSDEAERIRERERDWNKPKAPIRPSTPELKQGHRHGRFSSRMDSPMIGGSSARRASITSMNSVDGASSSSIGSQTEYREWVEESERERMHEREREWNKRRPNTSHLSPNGMPKMSGERVRARSLTHVTRPDSAMSASSVTSLQRQDSYSPSSGSSGTRQSPSEPMDEYVHERERNWNAPRPRWLQNPETRPSVPPTCSPPSSESQHLTSLNGRLRANSVRSTGSSQRDFDYNDQSLSSPLVEVKSSPTPSASSHVRSWSQPNHMSHQQPPVESLSRFGYQSKVPDRESSARLPASPFRARVQSQIANSRPNGQSSTSRPSHIPLRTPRKLAQPHSQTPVEVGNLPLVVVENSEYAQQEDRLSSDDDLRVDGGEEFILQERTPTIRTIQPPPLETTEETRTDSRYSEPLESFASNGHYSIAPDVPFLEHPQASALQELSPPPTPQKSDSTNYKSYTTSSFLQTPPRPTLGGSAKVDFHSPSPPRGLPELPGPPTISDEEDESDEPDNQRGVARERTPSRPAVQRDSKDVGDLTAMKTPKPPGAWTATPLPVQRPPDWAPKVQEESLLVGASDYDGGLVTPTASLSRASTLQTPAPPGAWVATPSTVRKSILKVRFEPPPSESTDTEQSVTSSIENPAITDHPPAKHLSPAPTDSVIQSAELVPVVRSRTPELQTSIVKPSSPKSPRKSPKIRVMDAFGRETLGNSSAQDGARTKVMKVSTPRNKSAIRVLDAMGREMDVNGNQTLGEEESLKQSLTSLGHREALVRVRQGLSDLAQGIDEINRVTTESKVDEERVQQLDDASRTARTKREQLAPRLHVAETDLRAKIQNAREGKSLAPVDRRPRFVVGSWVLWVAIMLQVILILAMYQFATKQARNIFLSTYYDPFYPDLHLYTIRPDTLRRTISSSGIPKISVLDSFQRDGWKATLGLAWDNVCIFIYDLRTRIWETWGDDSTQRVASWPPT
ncbi:hypothetical protein AX17_005788 [Amanita inopinata Kibby_2008]|nr:hypothetical protein AX17_005788 [Amanita inopinata Kibby_2008]